MTCYVPLYVTHFLCKFPYSLGRESLLYVAQKAWEAMSNSGQLGCDKAPGLVPNTADHPPEKEEWCSPSAPAGMSSSYLFNMSLPLHCDRGPWRQDPWIIWQTNLQGLEECLRSQTALLNTRQTVQWTRLTAGKEQESGYSLVLPPWQ